MFKSSKSLSERPSIAEDIKRSNEKLYGKLEEEVGELGEDGKIV